MAEAVRIGHGGDDDKKPRETQKRDEPAEAARA